MHRCSSHSHNGCIRAVANRFDQVAYDLRGEFRPIDPWGIMKLLGEPSEKSLQLVFTLPTDKGPLSSSAFFSCRSRFWSGSFFLLFIRGYLLLHGGHLVFLHSSSSYQSNSSVIVSGESACMVAWGTGSGRGTGSLCPEMGARGSRGQFSARSCASSFSKRTEIAWRLFIVFTYVIIVSGLRQPMRC